MVEFGTAEQQLIGSSDDVLARPAPPHPVAQFCLHKTLQLTLPGQLSRDPSLHPQTQLQLKTLLQRAPSTDLAVTSHSFRGHLTPDSPASRQFLSASPSVQKALYSNVAGS